MKNRLMIFICILGINHSTLLADENKFGVSFNPIRLFALGSTQLLSVAGTLSYFDNTKGVELAIPFFYQQDFSELDAVVYDPNGRKYEQIREKLATLDFQYRKYLRKETQGLYYGALLRYAYLEGEGKFYNNKLEKQHKFGIGILTGFQFQQRIEELNFYWGMNISFGGYFNKEVDVMASDFSVILGEDGRLFIDVEVLKFGIEF